MPVHHGEQGHMRGIQQALALVRGEKLTAGSIIDRWMVSRATAKRDLVRLEVAIPQLINERGVRRLPK